jgi:hypothetical protein
MVQVDPAVTQTIGTVVAGIVVVFSTAYGLIMKHKVKMAETRSDVASANSERVAADAQSALYTIMTDRLNSVESQLTGLRNALEDEKKKNRKFYFKTRLMELHIKRLETLMKSAGLDVPEMDEFPEEVE